MSYFQWRDTHVHACYACGSPLKPEQTDIIDNEFWCDDCVEEHLLWCDVCGDWVNQTGSGRCLHLWWNPWTGEWDGPGTYDFDPRGCRDSFLRLVAETGMRNDLMQAIANRNWSFEVSDYILYVNYHVSINNVSYGSAISDLEDRLDADKLHAGFFWLRLLICEEHPDTVEKTKKWLMEAK